VQAFCSQEALEPVSVEDDSKMMEQTYGITVIKAATPMFENIRWSGLSKDRCDGAQKSLQVDATNSVPLHRFIVAKCKVTGLAFDKIPQVVRRLPHLRLHG
jgi:hypothetical protein